MHPALRILCGAMSIGGLTGFSHGMNRGSPVNDTLVGGLAPIWVPVMIVGIPVRAAYLSCPHLNPTRAKQE